MWSDMRGYINEEIRQNLPFCKFLMFLLQTDQQTDRRTRPLIEVRGAEDALKKKKKKEKKKKKKKEKKSR